MTKKENSPRYDEELQKVLDSLCEVGYEMGDFLMKDDLENIGDLTSIHSWQMGFLMRELSYFGNLLSSISRTVRQLRSKEK